VAATMANKFTQPLTRRKSFAVVIAVALAVLLGWGGWELYGRFAGRPATPEQIKKQIRKYLAKQTGEKRFVPLLDLTAATVEGPTLVTNKKGNVKVVERKLGKLGLPDTSLSAYFRTNHVEVRTYEEMYRLIGEQLAAADVLLAQSHDVARLGGVVMASEASAYARTNALNLWLSARIAEAYLWPHLALVATNESTSLEADAVLNLSDIAFKEAGETNNVIRNYQLLIAHGSTKQADGARWRLSRIYEELGRDAEALALLKEVQSKSGRIERQITSLEARVNGRPAPR
jgi:hypothetical protein